MEIKEKLYPAIVVVGYNRPKSLQRLLNSISNANYNYSNVTLVISLDRSEICDKVLAVAEKFQWSHGKKEIRTFEERQGLRKHILQCGDLAERYGAVIILEDDVVVSPEFYNYTVEALEFYKKDEKVAGIALYSHKYNGYAQKLFEPVHNGYDTYMGQFSVTWGQCWSAAQWRSFRQWYHANSQTELKPQNNVPLAVTQWPETSWGKYFVYYIVNMDRYYVMPYEALATCFSDIGEHVQASDTLHQVPLLQAKRAYQFPKFDKAEKYDIFFESITIKKCFEHDISRNLSVDLFGLKNRIYDKRYLLSVDKKPFTRIKTYGMVMRPKELNIIYDVDGEGIYLYDTRKPIKQSKKGSMKNQIYYDSWGSDWKTALQFGTYEFLKKIKRKFSFK